SLAGAPHRVARDRAARRAAGARLDALLQHRGRDRPPGRRPPRPPPGEMRISLPVEPPRPLRRQHIGRLPCGTELPAPPVNVSYSGADRARGPPGPCPAPAVCLPRRETNVSRDKPGEDLGYLLQCLCVADPNQRLHAAMVLGLMGDAAQPAVPALVEALR